jgi:choline dehydrogenase-like flavoprotein
MDSVGLAQICAVELRAQSEQEPAAENRIELGEETDALGIPRVNLYWRRTAMDLHTIRATARLFAEYLAETDVGRARLNQWLLEDGGPETMPKTNHGRHHMGGTRMAHTPAEGIVDRNCKVFGQENLYIAGSSVFPTGGYCNPTLSIVQLALRLGDHLRSIA